MSQQNQAIQDNQDFSDNSGSIKTLAASVFTGLVFWSSLFALLFFCLTS